jgi:hypothetical protein
MKLIYLSILLSIIHSCNGSTHAPLLSLETETPQHYQAPDLATSAAKNKRICTPGTVTLSACLASGIVAIVLLSRLSSNSSFAPNSTPSNGTAPGNGTNPTPPAPVFPPCTVGRPCASATFPIDQRLNSSKVYAQEFQICFPALASGGWQGCGTSYIPKFLCYPNNSATVGDAEQEIVDALAPDCDNLPVYSAMGVATFEWTRPNTNPCADPQQVKKDNEEFLKELKSTCSDIKREIYLMPPQPFCNFTTIDPNRIFPGWICPQSRNNAKNKLKRGNRTINYAPKSKTHKGKK